MVKNDDENGTMSERRPYERPVIVESGQFETLLLGCMMAIDVVCNPPGPLDTSA
jgi:hypothetical protein